MANERKNLLLLLGFIFFGLAFSACSLVSPAATPTATAIPPTRTSVPLPTSTPTLVPDPPAIPIDLPDVGAITPTLPINTQTVLGLTFQSADGNRIAEGKGSIGLNEPIDIELDGIPAWLVGVPIDQGGSIWSVVLENGQVQSFMVQAEIVTPIRIMPEQLPPGMPPLLLIHRGAPRLFTAPAEDASPLTHPVIIGENPAHFAYIATDGDLVVNLEGEITRLPVNALPDARILQDENGRLLLLTGATDSYAHGVIGDTIEAGSISIIGTNPVRIESEIDVSPRVVEGHSPIWVDLDVDGKREIIVTLADENQGAQIVIFDENGSIKASGPPIGRGYRWRHQLAAIPSGELEPLVFVDNLTPHIEGTTEFYHYDQENGFVVVSNIKGFSTHRLGSRNLDMAIAGDLDGDGSYELLLPSETNDYLGAFQMQGAFANVAWTVRIPAPLSTNLAGVSLLDGTLAIGAGFENGILRLWLP